MHNKTNYAIYNYMQFISIIPYGLLIYSKQYRRKGNPKESIVLIVHPKVQQNPAFHCMDRSIRLLLGTL